MKKLLLISVLSLAYGAFAQESQDRAYVKDYSDTKATINMLDVASGKTKGLIYKETTTVNGVKNFVFTNADGSAGELLVPVNTNYKFATRTSDIFKSGYNAFAKEDFENAILVWRDTIYTYLPILELPEQPTFSMHSDLANYMDALVKTKRMKEAEALSKAIPYGSVPQTLASAGLSLARAFVAAGMFDAAQDVLEKVSLSGENIDLIPEFMAVLGDLRKSNRTKQALLWYTKLSNMADNPQKQGALVWMVYCDLLEGNKTSAEVYLSQIGNLPRTDKYFSLCQMIKGIFKAQAKKHSEALDMFSEGIVYGDVSADWTPELLYRAGLSYKALKQMVAANEIFSQCVLLYPEDVYSKLGSKEIVKLPEPKAEQSKAEAEQ